MAHIGQLYALCTKGTADVKSYASEGSQGFDLVALQAKFDVWPVEKMPGYDEKFDETTKTVVKE